MELISGKVNRKKFWITNAVLLTAFAALMTIFTFYDYEIVNSLYNGDSFFGRFFLIAGMLPPGINLACLFTCLFYKSKTKAKKTVYALLLFAAIFCWGILLLSYCEFEPLTCLLILLPSCLIAFALFIQLFKLIPKRTLETLFYIFLIANLFYLMETTLVESLKLFFGRIRYTDLSGGLNDFTRWFVPNGITGNYSFPSGHVSSACAAFVLILLCFVFNLKKWQKACLCAIAVAFALCTAFSRIILGDHYPTDVLFSFFTSCFMYPLAVVLIDKKMKSNDKQLDNDN